jgi:O-antigen ligase
MSYPVVSIVMAGAALVSLGLLVPAIRRARVAGDLDAATALTLGTGLLASLPIAIVAITGGVTRQLESFRQLATVLPGWYPGAERLGFALIAALAGFLIVRALLAGGAPVHVAGLFALCLWALAHLAAGFHNGALMSFRGSVLLICLLAATVLPRGRGAPLGAGILGVLLAIASGALAIFRNDVAFISPCEGCRHHGLAFTGVLPNENLLGIALVASIAFAFLGFRGRVRWWFMLYLAGMASATGSRGAAVAAVLTVLALAVVRPGLDGARIPLGRTAIAGLVLAGVVGVSVYLPQRHWDPSALTNRGLLWNVASSYVDRSPWVGYGSEGWSSLAESSEIPLAGQRSAHNQWMDVLFGAGWIGAALFVGIMVAAIWTARRARAAVLIALSAILTIGTTEGVWSIGAVDLISFSLVALILTGEDKPVTEALALTPSPSAPLRPARAIARPARATVSP